jgi:hypothetical protein
MLLFDRRLRGARYLGAVLPVHTGQESVTDISQESVPHGHVVDIRGGFGFREPVG